MGELLPSQFANGDAGIREGLPARICRVSQIAPDRVGSTLGRDASGIWRVTRGPEPVSLVIKGDEGLDGEFEVASLALYLTIVRIMNVLM